MIDPYKQLVIETAANRLVLRALLASLIVSGGDQGQRLAKAVLAAAEAMAPQALRLEGFDIETRTEAVDLLWKRTMAVLAEFTDQSDHSDVDRERVGQSETFFATWPRTIR
jgi:hypothetical protein